MKARKPELATALAQADRRWTTGGVVGAGNAATYWSTSYMRTLAACWERRPAHATRR